MWTIKHTNGKKLAAFEKVSEALTWIDNHSGDQYSELVHAGILYNRNHLQITKY